MNVWYKPRLQSVDNIIKTQVLGGEVSPRTGYGPRRPCRILTQKGQRKWKTAF